MFSQENQTIQAFTFNLLSKPDFFFLAYLDDSSCLLYAHNFGVVSYTSASWSSHSHTHAHTHRHTQSRTQTHTCMHTHVHTETHTCTYTQTHIHTCTHAHTHTDTRTQTHTCPRAHTYTHAHTDTHMHMHTQTHRHTRAHVHTHTMEYYSAITKNEIMSFSATWIDLQIIIRSEGSQTEKDNCHTISLIRGI